jgi:2-oxoglutarate ferredoxin oxidoreductase subunit beta
VNRLDFITGREPIHVDYEPGTVEIVEQHDGSRIALRKLDADYDIHDRRAATNFLMERQSAGEVVTGLLYIETESDDLHASLGTVKKPLNSLGERELCPGSAGLAKFNANLR